MNDFELEMLKKYDNKEVFTEEEIETLVFEYGIREYELDRLRWSISTQTIVELQDRYFSINWMRGATECQEHQFHTSEVVEVKCYKEVVEVEKWREVPRPEPQEEIELPIKDVLSYSRISLFKQCAYRYKLKYIEKNYTETTSLALQLGTLAHYIFELKHTPGQKMSLDEIWQGFLDGFDTTKQVKNEDGELVEELDRIKGWNELVEEYGFEIYEIDKKVGNSIEDRVEILKQKFFNEELEDEWEVIGLEEEFMITFNNKAKIKGYIDRIDRNKKTGEIRVIDYKTNKAPFDRSDLVSSMQFYIYALAVKEKYGQYPVASIYDMLFLDMKQEALSKGWEKRCEKALNKLLDSIIYYQELGTEHMPPNPCPLCHWCDYSKTNPNADPFYNMMCEYYSMWTRDNKTFAKNKEWKPPMSTTDDKDDDNDLDWW